MKKALWLPLAALASIWIFSLWNSAAMTSHTTRWRQQLEQAAALTNAENWPAVSAVLAESHQDWSRQQTYLHIVTGHGAVDEAESMYRRAMAFAAVQEDRELLAELAGLNEQLRLLAEMEQFRLGNIL